MSKLHKVEALLSKAVQWPIDREAVRLIALAEDCYLMPYLCPAKVWTCGWGETDGVVPGRRWTQEHADERFRVSLEHFAGEVANMLKRPATEKQLGALVSLAYNIGLGAIRKSTVLRLHNAGDTAGAARAFGLWNKATVNGQLVPLAGLTSRRAAEAALYLANDPEAPPERMPQAVQPESSLAASPIAQGGVVTAGAGVLAVAGEAKEALGPVGEAVAQAKTLVVGSLGLPGWAFPCVLIAVGVAVWWWRFKQRRGGWA
jgi:lysozyme